MSVNEIDPKQVKQNGKIKTVRRWQARYYDADGKEHAKNFEKKPAADAWEREQRAAVRAGTHVDPAAGQETFGAFAGRWLKTKRRLRPRTAASYQTTIRDRYEPLAGRRMRGIRRSDIQDLVDRWLAPPPDAGHGPLAGSTVVLSYRILKGIFRAAVEDGVIGRNPCTNIELPEVLPTQILLPTTEQLWDIHDLLAEHWRAPLLLMAACGPRIGECLGLCDDRINWDAGEIRIDQQWNEFNGALGPLKRGTRGRTIPAPEFVMDALQATKKARGLGEYGLLFWSGRRGRSRPWGQAAARAALAVAGTEIGNAELDPHDLRHLCASALIASGEDVTTVSYVLGHASPKITLDTYAHLWQRDDSRVRGRLEAAFARPSS